MQDLDSPAGVSAALTAPSGRSARRPSGSGSAFELVLIFLVCFVLAGGPPPDVNEAHYLAKAKHYWNPDWIPQDHFLSSADAHQVFYWSLGWLTLWLPLPAVAWVGRLLSWGLLAWAWRRLSVAVVPARWAAVLSGTLFFAAVARLHMAGEWVVGGVEAKGFAFVLVLLGLERIVRGHWRWVWPLLGGAAAFHVLVGGWSLLAAGVVWLLVGRRECPLRRMLPSLAVGVLLAVPGLWPALALTSAADRDTVVLANRIYVYYRLPHHLVVHTFQPMFLVRHALLLVGWTLLFWWGRALPSVARLGRFVYVAVALALIGVMIDWGLRGNPDLQASLLRYYWYRLSDVMLPLGSALVLTRLLFAWRESRPRLAQWGLAVAIVVCTSHVVDVYLQRRQLMLPGADRQTIAAVTEDFGAARRAYEDWRRVCQWAAENTATEAVFMTPRFQQTFKWYAGRAEVVTWKDVPQDAPALVEWWRRMREVFPRRGAVPGLVGHGDDELRRLAEKYGARYLIVDKRRGARPMSLPRVYPSIPSENDTYEVYELASNAQ